MNHTRTQNTTKHTFKNAKGTPNIIATDAVNTVVEKQREKALI